jgi:hypothetical protein
MTYYCEEIEAKANDREVCESAVKEVKVTVEPRSKQIRTFNYVL